MSEQITLKLKDPKHLDESAVELYLYKNFNGYKMLNIGYGTGKESCFIYDKKCLTIVDEYFKKHKSYLEDKAKGVVFLNPKDDFSKLQHSFSIVNIYDTSSDVYGKLKLATQLYNENGFIILHNFSEATVKDEFYKFLGDDDEIRPIIKVGDSIVLTPSRIADTCYGVMLTGDKNASLSRLLNLFEDIDVDVYNVDEPNPVILIEIDTDAPAHIRYNGYKDGKNKGKFYVPEYYSVDNKEVENE